ncbi:NepR family anti-sigma factor [Qipengyuania sp. JC766]
MSAKPTKSQPEWADGLKKLYKEVVDEPLPDSFKDLLDKLDNKGE